MLWVNKITSAIKTVLKEHLFSIVAFLIATTLTGVYYDFIDFSHAKFWGSKDVEETVKCLSYFLFLLTPGLLLFESHLQYKKNAMIHVFEVLISAVISGMYSWYTQVVEYHEEMNASDELIAYCTRLTIVYVIVAMAGAVYFLYKKSGETFESYFYKAVVGATKAGVIYFVFTIGIALIDWAFRSLFFTVGLDLWVMCMVVGLIGFPAGVYGVSHLEEDTSGFFKGLFGHVFTGLLGIGFLIVYAYVIKIVFTWTFPSNEAFKIMSGLFITGLIVWTIAQGVLEGKLLTLLRIMPLLFIPFIVIQSMCLYMRVAEYGFTFSRYEGLFLIIFEGLYELYYIFVLIRKKGIGSVLLTAIPVMVALFILVPGTNVYAVVTASQKKVVNEFISLVEAGDEGAYELSDKARSAYYEIEWECSVEGEAYLSGLKKRYDSEHMRELFTEYKPKQKENDEIPASYYKTSAGIHREKVELCGYKYFSMVKSDFKFSNDSDQSVDISAVPLRNERNNAQVLFEVDLREIITEMRKLDTSGAEHDELVEVINQPIKAGDGIFYIEYLGFKVDRKDETVIKELNIDGFYVYN